MKQSPRNTALSDLSITDVPLQERERETKVVSLHVSELNI